LGEANAIGAGGRPNWKWVVVGSSDKLEPEIAG
jgi:hypothetical protein